MIHCSSYDLYNIIIDMDFLKKVDIIKQYTQTIMNRGKVDFFRSVMQKIQRL